MTTVVCSLVNPFVSSSSRWEKLRFQLSTSGVFQAPANIRKKKSNPDATNGELDAGAAAATDNTTVWEPPKKLDIIAEITSDNENMRERQIVAKFSYDLKLLADVQVGAKIPLRFVQ